MTKSEGTQDVGKAITVLSGETLLVGRLDSALICSVSPATWDRLNAAAKTPRSIKLGGRVVWRRSDIVAWINLGCPDRKTFETLTRS